MDKQQIRRVARIIPLHLQFDFIYLYFTLKKLEGTSLPNVVMGTVKTPIENANPHQPILDADGGKREKELVKAQQTE